MSALVKTYIQAITVKNGIGNLLESDLKNSSDYVILAKEIKQRISETKGMIEYLKEEDIKIFLKKDSQKQIFRDLDLLGKQLGAFLLTKTKYVTGYADKLVDKVVAGFWKSVLSQNKPKEQAYEEMLPGEKNKKHSDSEEGFCLIEDSQKESAVVTTQYHI